MLYSTTSVMYSSMTNTEDIDPHRKDAMEVGSCWCYHTAVGRYFEEQKLVMLEKMEDATTDGERIGYAENINILGNFIQQTENINMLYVLNMEQKYPTIYEEFTRDERILEHSIEWFRTNRLVAGADDLVGATSAHYGVIYRMVQQSQSANFTDLLDKKQCDAMGAKFNVVHHAKMTQYNFSPTVGSD
jgi:hypothetical protein